MSGKTGNGIDHPLITETLFYPQTISESDVPPEGGEILRIPAGGDTLGAYHYHPLPGAPTVLFFHGNGEVMVDYLHGFHKQVEGSGANFLVVDYRGYGLSGGGPSLSKLKEDARSAWSYATGEMGMAPGDIVVMGRSLGSLAALEIVSDLGEKARGLVIESGIARFDHWIDRMAAFLSQLGMDVDALKADLVENFNHEKKIKAYPGPVLVMHAPNDEIVPVTHGRTLFDWAGEDRGSLKVFPRGGHNDIHFVNQGEYFKTLAGFLKKLS